MLLVAGLFIILGILIKYGKLYFLIAGYNTMSKEEKAKFDIEKIASVFRNAMFGMASIILLGFLLGNWLDNPKIENIAFYVAILMGLPYLLIASNQDRYKKKDL
jgi:hypothetical protein